MQLLYKQYNLIDESRNISVDSESGQTNRLFLIIALALIGLICIGLMGLGAIIFLTRSNQAQESVVAQPTATFLPPTPTLTDTPSATPTETPLHTPTATMVISNQPDQQPTPAADQAQPATETPTPGDAQPATETPTLDPNITPTNTLVLQTPTQAATPAGTPVATPTAPTAQIPTSGGILAADENGFLIWAGLILLAALSLGVANYLTSPPPDG